MALFDDYKSFASDYNKRYGKSFNEDDEEEKKNIVQTKTNNFDDYSSFSQSYNEKYQKKTQEQEIGKKQESVQEVKQEPVKEVKQEPVQEVQQKPKNKIYSAINNVISFATDKMQEWGFVGESRRAVSKEKEKSLQQKDFEMTTGFSGENIPVIRNEILKTNARDYIEYLEKVQKEVEELKQDSSLYLAKQRKELKDANQEFNARELLENKQKRLKEIALEMGYFSKEGLKAEDIKDITFKDIQAEGLLSFIKEEKYWAQQNITLNDEVLGEVPVDDNVWSQIGKAIKSKTYLPSLLKGREAELQEDYLLAMDAIQQGASVAHLTPNQRSAIIRQTNKDWEEMIDRGIWAELPQGLSDMTGYMVDLAIATALSGGNPLLAGGVEQLTSISKTAQRIRANTEDQFTFIPMEDKDGFRIMTTKLGTEDDVKGTISALAGGYVETAIELLLGKGIDKLLATGGNAVVKSGVGKRVLEAPITKKLGEGFIVKSIKKAENFLRKSPTAKFILQSTGLDSIAGEIAEELLQDMTNSITSGDEYEISTDYIADVASHTALLTFIAGSVTRLGGAMTDAQIQAFVNEVNNNKQVYGLPEEAELTSDGTVIDTETQQDITEGILDGSQIVDKTGAFDELETDITKVEEKIVTEETKVEDVLFEDNDKTKQYFEDEFKGKTEVLEAIDKIGGVNKVQRAVVDISQIETSEKINVESDGVQRAIKEIQEGIKVPLIARRLENGNYLIEDGNHRFVAYKELGIKEVPIITEKVAKTTQEQQPKVKEASSKIKIEDKRADQFTQEDREQIIKTLDSKKIEYDSQAPTHILNGIAVASTISDAQIREMAKDAMRYYVLRGDSLESFTQQGSTLPAFSGWFNIGGYVDGKRVGNNTVVMEMADGRVLKFNKKELYDEIKRESKETKPPETQKEKVKEEEKKEKPTKKREEPVEKKVSKEGSKLAEELLLSFREQLRNLKNNPAKVIREQAKDGEFGQLLVERKSDRELLAMPVVKTWVKNKIAELESAIVYGERLAEEVSKVSTDKIAILESKAQSEYEKNWNKLTPQQQLKVLMSLEDGQRYIKTADQDTLMKLGKGVGILSLKDTATADKQEIFLWGGEREGLYTDGIVLFTDRPVAKKIIDKFQEQYINKEAQRIKKAENISLIEAKKKVQAEFTKQWIADISFPETQSILDSVKANFKLEPIGFYADKTNRQSGSVIFRAENGTLVRLSGKYYSAIKSFYPSAEFYITDESNVKPVSFVVGKSRKGIVMPMMLPSDSTFTNLVGKENVKVNEENQKKAEEKMDRERRIESAKELKEEDVKHSIGLGLQEYIYDGKKLEQIPTHKGKIGYLGQGTYEYNKNTGQAVALLADGRKFEFELTPIYDSIIESIVKSRVDGRTWMEETFGKEEFKKRFPNGIPKKEEAEDSDIAFYTTARRRQRGVENKVIATPREVREGGDGQLMLTDSTVATVREEDTLKAKEDESKDSQNIETYEQREVTPAEQLKMSEEVKTLVHKYADKVGEKYLPRGVLGMFYGKTKEIRLKGITDLYVASHEISHAIDKKYDITARVTARDNVDMQLRKAYMNLYPTAKETHAIKIQKMEGFAMAVATYLQRPSSFAVEYPAIVKEMFTQGGKYYNTEIGEYLNDVNNIVSRYQSLNDLDRVATRISKDIPVVEQTLFKSKTEAIINMLQNDLNLFERWVKENGDIMTKADFTNLFRFRTQVKQIYENNIATNLSKKNVEEGKFKNFMGGLYSYIRKSVAQDVYMAYNPETKNIEKRYDFNWGTLRREIAQKGMDRQFNSLLVARRAYYDFEYADKLKMEKETIQANLESLQDEVIEMYKKKEGDRDKRAEKALEAEIEKTKVLLQEIETNLKEVETLLKNDGWDRRLVTDSYLNNQGLFEKELDMYDKLVEQDLLLAKQVGIISNDKYNELKNNKGYAPFKRIIYDEVLGEVDPSEISGNLKLGSKEISSLKKRTGSTKEIIYPLQSAMRNHMEFLNKSVAQDAINTFLTDRTIEMHSANIKQVEWHKGIENQKDILIKMENGVRKAYAVDPMIKELIAGYLSPKQVDLLERVQQSYKQLFTMGTTGTYFQFVFTNLPRDAFNYITQTYQSSSIKAIYNLFADTAKVILGNNADNNLELQYFQKYLALGGREMTFVKYMEGDYDAFTSFLRQEEKGLKKIKNTIGKVAKTGLDILSMPSQLSEMWYRSVEFIEAKKSGDSDVVALEKARRVTTPFHHRGSFKFKDSKGNIVKAPPIPKYAPFQNASLQAFAWAGGNFVKDPKIRSRMIFMIALTTALGLEELFRAWGGAGDDDKEQFKDLSAEDLSRFIHLPKKGGGIKRIAVAEWAGSIAGTINMAVMDYILEDDVDYNVTDYATALTTLVPDQFNLLTPVIKLLEKGTWDEFGKWGSSLLPALANPIIAMMGYKTYPEFAPLESDWQKRKLPADRYNEGTSKFAKWAMSLELPFDKGRLGDNLNLSPIQLDAILTQSFGRTIGMITGKPDAWNVLKSVNREYYFEYGRRLNDYWDIKEKNDQLYNSMTDGTRKYSKEKELEVFRRKALSKDIDKALDEYKEAYDSKDLEKIESTRGKVIDLITRYNENPSTPEMEMYLANPTPATMEEAMRARALREISMKDPRDYTKDELAEAKALAKEFRQEALLARSDYSYSELLFGITKNDDKVVKIQEVINSKNMKTAELKKYLASLKYSGMISNDVIIKLYNTGVIDYNIGKWAYDLESNRNF